MSKVTRRSLKASSPVDQPAAEDIAETSTTRMSMEETAQYVAEFSAELSFLAREAKLDLLAYLLDMARLEAIRSLQVAERKR